jgi:hypothetical protein
LAISFLKNEIDFDLKVMKKYHFFIKIPKFFNQFLSLFLHSISVHGHHYLNPKAASLELYGVHFNFRVFANFVVRELILVYFIELIFFSRFLTKNISLSPSYLKNLNYFFLNFLIHPNLIIIYFEWGVTFFS